MGRKSNAQKAAELIPHNDGWANILTGAGILGKDKRLSTAPSATVILSEIEALDIFRGDGIGRRLVTLPVHDMTREWFTVEGDTENAVVDYLKKRRTKTSIIEALTWGNLYGGAIAVMLIDDGGELTDPVRPQAIRSIQGFHVFNKWRISLNSLNYYSDPKEPKFGQPKTYSVSPLLGTMFDVHETRVLRFDGDKMPDRVVVSNQGWGDSILQSVYDRLRGLADSYMGAEHIIQEFIQGVLKMKNLQELIAAGRDQLVKDRLAQVDLSKHIMNTVLLDSEESFERVTSTVTGLSDLLDRLVQTIAASRGIPITLLMGESPAGLKATGASDIRFYYDMIAGEQETKLLPELEKLVSYTYSAQDGPTKGKVPEAWAIKFGSLWQHTEKEIAETRYIQAQTDEKYVATGVLQPEEIRESRFGGGSYSLDTTLSGDDMPDLGEPDDEDLNTIGGE